MYFGVTFHALSNGIFSLQSQNFSATSLGGDLMDTLLIRYPDLFNGIPFYYDQNIQLNSNFIEHGKQLSFVLRKVRVGEFQYR